MPIELEKESKNLNKFIEYVEAQLIIHKKK